MKKTISMIAAMICSIYIYASGPNVKFNCITEKFSSITSESTITLIVINGADCINCYAKMNYLLPVILKENKKVWFSFFNLSKSDIKYFIANTLTFNIEQESIIPFEAVKTCMNDVLLSSVIFIDKRDSTNSFFNSLRELSMEEEHKLIPSPVEESGMQQPVDSFDITEWAGSSRMDIVHYNDTNLLIYNWLRGTIYNYDLKRRSVIWSVSQTYFEPAMDSILMLNKKEIDPEVIVFNKTDPLNKLSYFPQRIIMQVPYALNNNLYIPLEIVSYGIDPQANPDMDTFITRYSFLAKMNAEQKLTKIWAFPTVIEEVPKSYNYFLNWGLIDSDEIYMQVSSYRADDSLFVLQTLSENNVYPVFNRLLRIGYPKMLPRYNEQGITKWYSAKRVQINDASYFYYYSQANILLNENGLEKIELSNWISPSDTAKNARFHLTNAIQNPRNKIIYVSGVDQNRVAKVKTYDPGFRYQKEYGLYPPAVRIIENAPGILTGLYLTDEKTILYTYRLP